jgi:hypothetical protein
MINRRTITIDPRKLKLLELNARFMRHETFARLVENIRADGGLVGDTPFAWRVHDDTTQQPITIENEFVYEVLSGNHRTRAAIVADIPEIELTITDDYLSPDKRKAIQLSRNAITGEDDPATLKLLYDSITDHTLKIYSGLDDKQLKLMTDAEIASLSEANLQFQTISLTFLPNEVELITETFASARKLYPTDGYWIMRFADYDKTLDALEQTGQAHNIKNIATCFSLILDIFNRHRDELCAAFLDAEDNPTVKSRAVPLVALFNSDTIPVNTASRLKKILARLDNDPLKALDKLLDLADVKH